MKDKILFPKPNQKWNRGRWT